MRDMLQRHDLHARFREQCNFSQQRDLEMIPMWKTARASFLLTFPIRCNERTRLAKFAG
jgi:hypothetical protein